MMSRISLSCVCLLGCSLIAGCASSEFFEEGRLSSELNKRDAAIEELKSHDYKKPRIVASQISSISVPDFISGVPVFDDQPDSQSIEAKHGLSLVANADRNIQYTIAPAAAPASRKLMVKDHVNDADSNHAIINMFYGTNRTEDYTHEDGEIFSGNRGRNITYGILKVSIPEDHIMGKIERPYDVNIFRLITLRSPFVNSGDENIDDHFVILNAIETDKELFFKSIRNLLETDKISSNHVTVFIHGFNTSFNEASYTAAQLFSDINYKGAPIIYSWPSSGKLYDYERDQNSSRLSQRLLKRFLEELVLETEFDKIHLVAHSMGSSLLMEVLADMNNTRDQSQENIFGQVVLAAPDIDRDVFSILVEDAFGIADGITVYSSSNDRAMQVAKKLNGGIPKAGDVVGGHPQILDGIYSIDASATGENILGVNHSYFGNNETILNDIARLLVDEPIQSPDDRTPTLKEVSLSQEASGSNTSETLLDDIWKTEPAAAAPEIYWKVPLQ